jgi:type II secretory pathway pseudopilin PulG
MQVRKNSRLSNKAFAQKNKAFAPKNKAFTMIEVMFMLIMFTMLIMVFGAILPTMAKSSTQSNIYTVVASIAQSKVTQLQEAGYAGMNGPDLGEAGRKIVDISGGSLLTSNTDGKGVAQFTFTERDKLWKYLPGGILSNGQPNLLGTDAPYGTIKVEPMSGTYYVEDSATTGGTTPPSVAGLIKATVTISWKTANMPRVNYTVITFIPRSSFQ